jgi:hypothetical protein
MQVAFDRAAGYLLYDRAEFDNSPGVPSKEAFQGRVLDLSDFIGIPSALSNFQRLHGAGFPVPPPLDAFNYDWPGRLKPFMAQVVTANMLVLNPVCFVVNEMRTGKTLSALWASDFLMRAYPGAKTLILSNLSTLSDVWFSSIREHFLGRRQAVIVHSYDDKSRFKKLDQDVDYYILNHDAMRQGVIWEGREGRKRMKFSGLMGELLARKDICIVIIDEASAFKDSTTQRSKAARQLIAMNKPVKWAMTGSPTPQAPTDIHGLRKLIDPDYINHFSHLRSYLMTPSPRSKWRWDPKPGAYEMAADMLQPRVVRFRAVDCFDAPPQSITKRSAPLSPEQRSALISLKQNAMALIRQKDKTTAVVKAANAGVIRSKTLQMLAGSVYDDTGRSIPIDASPRLRVLDEVLAETTEKAIILCPFTAPLHALRRHLGAERAELVNGDVRAQERTEAISRFTHDPRKRFLIAQPEVLKFGLDLSVASIVIWYSPTDKTETWIQANKRVCGPRQKKPTLVVCIHAHGVEQEVYRRLENHEDMQDVFLCLIENRDKTDD